MEVWLYWLGCWKALTHWRDPTTARHGNFWLLGYPPGPFRSSLFNLDLPDSSRRPMSMPGLVRTPVRRKRRSSRTPSLKPATPPSLPVAGLQVLATYPAKRRSLFWEHMIGIGFQQKHCKLLLRPWTTLLEINLSLKTETRITFNLCLF